MATKLSNVIGPNEAVIHQDISLDYIDACGRDSIIGSGLLAIGDDFATETAEGNAEVMSKTFDLFDRTPKPNQLDTSPGATCGTPGEITQGQESIFKLLDNYTFRSELAAMHKKACSAPDPMKYITENLTNQYWHYHYEVYVLQMINGLISHNLGLGTADQRIYDCISNAANGGNDETLNSAHFHRSRNVVNCTGMGGLIIHQAVATEMLVNDILVSKYDEEYGNTLYNLRDGTSVTVVHDGDLMPYLQAPNANEYWSIRFRAGAVPWADGCHKTPMHIEHEPCANGGDGAEVLHSRRAWAQGIKGVQFLGYGATTPVPPIANTYSADELTNPALYQYTIPKDKSSMLFLLSKAS